MSELKSYIEAARKAGLDSETITKNLKQEGWSDKDISSALDKDTPTVPKAPSAKTGDARPTMSPLVAALHHIFLWFFSSLATISIYTTIAAIANDGPDSQSALVMGLITIISLAVYLGFYIPFLIKTVKPPFQTAHKVWSIITICIHGLSALGFLIALVPIVVYGAPVWVVVATAITIFWNLAVVGTYLAATFLPVKHSLRPAIIWTLMPIFVIVIITLLVVSTVTSSTSKSYSDPYYNPYGIY